MADPTPLDPSQVPQNPYSMPNPSGYNPYAPPPAQGVPSIPAMGDNGIGVNSYGMPGGPVSGVSMQYDGTPINMRNPGMMDPTQLNPYAGQYLNQINGMMSQFQSSASGGAFNPDFYKGMHDTQQANLTTGIENSYARMGLAGSSAEMGGISNAITNNDMSWLNRQQSDQMKAMTGMESLNNMGMKDVMGIQGQYGDFQDSYNQDILSLLGVNQQAQASQNQMIGQGIGGIGQMAMMAAMFL